VVLVSDYSAALAGLTDFPVLRKPGAAARTGAHDGGSAAGQGEQIMRVQPALLFAANTADATLAAVGARPALWPLAKLRLEHLAADLAVDLAGTAPAEGRLMR